MIKAVIFDVDGLMFDTESIAKENFYKVNKKFNLEFDENYRASCIGKSEKLIRQEMKEQFPNFDVDSYRECLLNEQDKRIAKGKIREMKGLHQLLDYLTNNKYKLSIISGSPINRIELLLKMNNIDSCIFTTIVDGKTNLKPKPYPDAFLYCAKQMKVKPAECVMLEDAYNGIRGAYDAGCKSIMIPDTVPVTDEMREKATILNDLTQVITYLQNQN